MSKEIEIFKAVIKGDSRAFNALYSLYAKKIFNTAFNYTQNVEEAEEITQDAFIKIYKYASSFRRQSALSTWIYRLAINASLDHLKKKQNKSKEDVDINPDMLVDLNHPGVLLENKEKAVFLYSALNTLPHSQKTAFILGFIQGLPRQVIADIMETSLKAVESLLQRAKKNLRVELGKFYTKRNY